MTRDKQARALLDDGFPLDEQIPRHMDVVIHETASGRVIMCINGVRTGDPLTDNRYIDDGYRFHDIFHLAYAGILGWSPTLRSLMGRKRKSVPKIDEVEDGGRAIAIEEGIVAMVFSYAERHNFLEGTQKVSPDLIHMIKDMTAHLEVSSRSAEDWQRAIMSGFEIWRAARALGGGLIKVNLDQGSFYLAS